MMGKKTYMDTLLELVADDMRCVDTHIAKSMQNDIPLIAQVAEYLISAGGKRLRPILTLLTAKMCGDKTDIAPLYATCVELIHTATLLHDDVIDDSVLRRGKKSAHTIWGNQATILVGDFLFSRTFQLMAYANFPKATQVLADATTRLAEGEILQLLTVKNMQTTRSQYLAMIKAKTAVLFSSACKIGGVLNDLSAPHCDSLYAFGENLGVAFQLIDDAIDYSNNTSGMGKNVGDDFREGKITLPLLIVLEEANPQEKLFLSRTIKDCFQKDGDLEEMQILLKKYNALEKTYDLANTYGRKAKVALAIFKDCQYKHALHTVIEYTTQKV